MSDQPDDMYQYGGDNVAPPVQQPGDSQVAGPNPVGTDCAPITQFQQQVWGPGNQVLRNFDLPVPGDRNHLHVMVIGDQNNPREAQMLARLSALLNRMDWRTLNNDQAVPCPQTFAPAPVYGQPQQNFPCQQFFSQPQQSCQPYYNQFNQHQQRPMTAQQELRHFERELMMQQRQRHIPVTQAEQMLLQQERQLASQYQYLPPALQAQLHARERMVEQQAYQYQSSYQNQFQSPYQNQFQSPYEYQQTNQIMTPYQSMQPSISLGLSNLGNMLGGGRRGRGGRGGSGGGGLSVDLTL